MSELSAGRTSRWYQSLDWTQWKALIASNLGWTFDGFEVFALILTVGAALLERRVRRGIGFLNDAR